MVTGATRGIGAATARMLAQEGARVLSVARRDADLELDVTAPDAGERVLARCHEPPWALVNNAGTSSVRSLEELSDEDWQDQWELHVMAPMRLMRALAPAMAAAGGGRIVNVSSSSGKRPSLGTSTPPTRSPRRPSCRSAACSPTRARPTACWSTPWRPGRWRTSSGPGEGGLADQVAERPGSTREEVLASTRSRRRSGGWAARTRSPR